MYITNIIDYIAKKRELRDAAPERCCLTLTTSLMALIIIFHSVELLACTHSVDL